MRYRSAILLFLLFFSCLIKLEAQVTPNEVDSLGLKQGMWREFRIPSDAVTPRVETHVLKINKEYYDMDRKYLPIIESIGKYVDNKKTGIWTEYHPNGKIRSRINYEDGVPYGKCQFFWENGVLKMECCIDDNVKFPKVMYKVNGDLYSKRMGSKNEVIKAIYQN